MADDPLGEGFVHGDFHSDNVVITPSGPVLIDLELAGGGPVSWDLVPQRVALRRYGASPEGHERFCRAYGVDPLAWDGAERLCQIYELVLGAWAIGHRDRSPEMTLEAARRLDGLLGRDDAPWTLS